MKLKKLVSDKNVIFSWICALLLIVFCAIQFLPYWTFMVNVPVIEKQPYPEQIVDVTQNCLQALEDSKATEAKAVQKVEEATKKVEESDAAVKAAEEAIATQGETEETKSALESAKSDKEYNESSLNDAKAALESLNNEKAALEELAKNPKCEACDAALDVAAINKKIEELKTTYKDTYDKIALDLAASAEAFGVEAENLKRSIKESIKKLPQENLYIKCDNCKKEFWSVFSTTSRMVPYDVEISNFDEERKASVVDYVWMTYKHTAAKERKDLVADKSGLEDYFNKEFNTTFKVNDIILFPALFMTFAIFGIIFAFLKPKSIYPVLFTLVSGLFGILGFLTVPAMKLGSLFIVNVIISFVVFVFAAFVLFLAIKKKMKKA